MVVYQLHLLLDEGLIDPADEANDDADQQHVDQSLDALRPRLRLVGVLDARVDELPVRHRQVLGALGEPALRLRQREPHQQRVVAAIRRAPPASARRAASSRLRQLRNSRSARSTRAACPSAGRSPRAPPPHRSRRPRASAVTSRRFGWSASSLTSRHSSSENSERERAPPRRLAVLAHGGKPQREHAPQRVLGLGMRRKEGIGALDQHAAELDRGRRQAQHAVAALDHLRPHVVEQVGQERQRAGVLGRFLGRPPRDVGRKPVGLEARRQQRGRAGSRPRAAPPRAAAARRSAGAH